MVVVAMVVWARVCICVGGRGEGGLSVTRRKQQKRGTSFGRPTRRRRQTRAAAAAPPPPPAGAAFAAPPPTPSPPPVLLARPASHHPTISAVCSSLSFTFWYYWHFSAQADRPHCLRHHPKDETHPSKADGDELPAHTRRDAAARASWVGREEEVHVRVASSHVNTATTTTSNNAKQQAQRARKSKRGLAPHHTIPAKKGQHRIRAAGGRRPRPRRRRCRLVAG
jgi:hypothetical protein